MAEVKALYGFDHYGLKKRGQVFEVTDETAADLKRQGLVSLVQGAAAKPKADDGKQGVPAKKSAAKPKADDKGTSDAADH